MSDEDSDAEAQGVDALRLLKHCSSPKGVTRKLAGASTSGIDSAPLVSLVAANKRSRTPSQDISETRRPSGFQKVKSGSLASTVREYPADVRGPLHKEKDLLGQRSAPDQIRNFARELRACRSAPDLTIPALAAIRGLQDGTLQVDRQTRIKIATAAKRVLEARELKRRASQDREAQARLLEASAVLASSPGSQTEPACDQPIGSLPASKSNTERLAAGEAGSSLHTGGQHRLPSSLGTAAAIAGGQYNVQHPSPYNATSPEACAGNFHRPALGAGSPGGVLLLSASHPPFTVTTGLPRFTTDTSNPGDSNQTQTPNPSKNPAEPRLQDVPQTLPFSKTLSMGDIPRSDPQGGH